MRKFWLIFTAALTALLLTACAARTAEEPAAETAAPTPVILEAATPAPAPPAEESAAPLFLAVPGTHPALMSCDGDGAFRPAEAVTRAELCLGLAALLRNLPAGTGTFTDLPRSDAAYDAAASLCAAGVLRPEEDGAFGPERAVARGELAAALDRLARRLSGHAAERAEALAAEVEAGRGDDAADETGPVARAELAAVLVRLSGREPDEAALFIGGRMPTDMTMDDEDWAFAADAVTEGFPESPEPGVHRAYGWLYAVWEDGTLVRDMDFGVWTFGVDGGYTTGDEELDGYLRDALAESGANELTGRDALAAVYLYVKYYGEYLVRPEDMETIPVGETGWEYDRGVRFFRYGGGTCYGFAAAFGLLARALGENAYIVSAEVNQYHGAHAFVVIPAGGEDLIYDVELEATRPERHADLALFGLTPTGYYHYWYDPDWD